MKHNFKSASESLPVFFDGKARNEEHQLLSDLASDDVQGIKTTCL